MVVVSDSFAVFKTSFELTVKLSDVVSAEDDTAQTEVVSAILLTGSSPSVSAIFPQAVSIIAAANKRNKSFFIPASLSFKSHRNASAPEGFFKTVRVLDISDVRVGITACEAVIEQHDAVITEQTYIAI